MITKKTTIGEIMDLDAENALILLGFGLHCCACPKAREETLEQACKAHKLDVDFVLERLNDK